MSDIMRQCNTQKSDIMLQHNTQMSDILDEHMDKVPIRASSCRGLSKYLVASPHGAEMLCQLASGLICSHAVMVSAGKMSMFSLAMWEAFFA